MITLKAGYKELEFWSSIEELPMERYIQFQIMAFQDAGLGSTLLDYDKHEESIDTFLAAERYEDAIKQRENKRFSVYMMLEKMSTKSLTLACLCNRIGKDLKFDISTDGLTSTSKEINKTGIPFIEIKRFTNELKKNWNQN